MLVGHVQKALNPTSCQRISKNHAKQRRSTISKLENDLLEVNETLASQPTDEDLLSRRA
jgi:hypothetical protein